MDDLDKLDIIKDYVRTQVGPYRYRHTLGVIEVAIDLAYIYGVDPTGAYISALCHDMAKDYSGNKKRNLCKKYKIQIDNFLDSNIHLTHGLIGACIVEDKFNIKDIDVLNAIKNHTLGRCGMSKLEKIIYISDIIEPNRKKTPKLDKLRELAYTDLDKSMKFAIDRNIDYLTLKNKVIHPIIYLIADEYKDKEEVDDSI